MEMYVTLFATKWCIPFVMGITYAIDIMISETVRFLSNYVTRSKEERYDTNGQNIQII